MPRALGTGSGTLGKTGRHQGPSFTGPSLQAQLVEPAGPRNQARVSRDRWLIPQALGPGCMSPGDVVDPAGPQTHALVVGGIK